MIINFEVGDTTTRLDMLEHFDSLPEGDRYIAIICNTRVLYVSRTLKENFWDNALKVFEKQHIHSVAIYTNCLDSRTHKWIRDLEVFSTIYLYIKKEIRFRETINKVIIDKVVLSKSKQKEKINAEEFEITKESIGKEVLKKLVMEETLKEEERIMEGTTKENAYEDTTKPCIEDTLEERGNSYGEFAEHARITQAIKRAMRDSPNWGDLSDDKKEALEMDAHKTGRILNGDPELHDSWWDKSGYITLVANTLIEIKE